MCEKLLTNRIAEMFRLILLVFLSITELVSGSSILVKDGVYSRVTVQIQDQPQPDSCVDFLDHLEVRNHLIFIVFFYSLVIKSSTFVVTVSFNFTCLDTKRQSKLSENNSC